MFNRIIEEWNNNVAMLLKFFEGLYEKGISDDDFYLLKEEQGKNHSISDVRKNNS